MPWPAVQCGSDTWGTHFLAVVTNRFSYLQVEEMINVGPLLVLKLVIELC